VKTNTDLACWQHFKATTILLQQSHSCCDNYVAQLVYWTPSKSIWEKASQRTDEKQKC